MTTSQTIQVLPIAEMPGSGITSHGAIPSPLSEAALQLAPGHGLITACRPHNSTGCPDGKMARCYARLHHGGKFHIYHDKDGRLCIVRLPDRETP